MSFVDKKGFEWNTELQVDLANTWIDNPNLEPLEISKMVTKNDGSNPSEAYAKQIQQKLENKEREQNLEFIVPENIPEYKDEEMDDEEYDDWEIPELVSEEYETNDGELEIDFEDESLEFSITDMSDMIYLIEDILIDNTGWKGWKLRVEQRNKLATLSSKMLDKYAPTIFDDYFLEVQFSFVLLTVAYSKTRQYRKWVKDQNLKGEPKDE